MARSWAPLFSNFLNGKIKSLDALAWFPIDAAAVESSGFDHVFETRTRDDTPTVEQMQPRRGHFDVQKRLKMILEEQKQPLFAPDDLSKTLSRAEIEATRSPQFGSIQRPTKKK